MKLPVQCEITSAEVQDMLVKIAERCGWGGVCMKKVYRYFIVGHLPGCFSGHNRLETNFGEVITLEEAIAILKKGPPKPITLIETQPVWLNPNGDGVRVGCISIDREQVKEIYNAVFPPPSYDVTLSMTHDEAKVLRTILGYIVHFEPTAGFGSRHVDSLKDALDSARVSEDS